MNNFSNTYSVWKLQCGYSSVICNGGGVIYNIHMNFESFLNIFLIKHIFNIAEYTCFILS